TRDFDGVVRARKRGRAVDGDVAATRAVQEGVARTARYAERAEGARARRVILERDAVAAARNACVAEVDVVGRRPDEDALRRRAGDRGRAEADCAAAGDACEVAARCA